MLKTPYLSQYLMDFNKRELKFTLDCLKVENSYMLLIDVISFKVRLINFVYFLETHGSLEGHGFHFKNA